MTGPGKVSGGSESTSSLAGRDSSELPLCNATQAEVARLRAAIRKAVEDIEAEHYADLTIGMRRPGCFICWPRVGSWPCDARMVADDLRAALVEGGGE